MKNPHDVVWKGFGAVAKCNADAVGVAPAGESGPCDYGLVVIPEATLLLVACDTEGGVNMTDWAQKRRK